MRVPVAEYVALILSSGLGDSASGPPSTEVAPLGVTALDYWASSSGAGASFGPLHDLRLNANTFCERFSGAGSSGRLVFGWQSAIFIGNFASRGSCLNSFNSCLDPSQRSSTLYETSVPTRSNGCFFERSMSSSTSLWDRLEFWIHLSHVKLSSFMRPSSKSTGNQLEHHGIPLQSLFLPSASSFTSLYPITNTGLVWYHERNVHWTFFGVTRHPFKLSLPERGLSLPFKDMNPLRPERTRICCAKQQLSSASDFNAGAPPQL